MLLATVVNHSSSEGKEFPYRTAKEPIERRRTRRCGIIMGIQPMQTIKFNKRAIAFLGGGLALIVCTLVLLSTGTGRAETQKDSVPVRDALLRNKIAGEEVVHDDVVRKEALSLSMRDQKLAERFAVNGKKEQQVEAPKESTDNEARRLKIVEMMKHAWGGYKKHAWGMNEIRPIAKTANNQDIFGGPGMGATIVDAADTLYIMGLKDEYEAARKWISEHFDIKKQATRLSVFETTIRFLGGMLSLYALTGDELYKTKATEVGDALLPAFKSSTGIPYSLLNVKNGEASNFGWASGGSSILAEIGTLHLEFLYLSNITGQPIFEKKVQKVRDTLDKAEKPGGLYSNYISNSNGRFSGEHVSLGALGDSFYEYLIKGWIQSNFKDEQARRMYWSASKAIQERLIFKSKPSGLTYLAELKQNRPDHQMGHLACFATGMFALEGHYEKDEETKKTTMSIAEEVGRTCHESYTRTKSGIGPEMFYFNNGDEATSKNPSGYILRPEAIEGWFYLWRLTGNEKYRDWVWDAMMSIEKHCRKEGGYAGLSDVNNPERGADDVQQSFFLAETLKYAYLTFTDSSVISLDKWVFNTEAHPLPILFK